LENSGKSPKIRQKQSILPIRSVRWPKSNIARAGWYEPDVQKANRQIISDTNGVASPSLAHGLNPFVDFGQESQQSRHATTGVP
jgi:hypothetical protein